MSAYDKRPDVTNKTVFSIESFYTKRAKKKSRIDWEERLSRMEQQLKHRPVIKPYKPRLNSMCPYWKTFYKQQDAFDFVHRTSQALKVFAYESPALSSAGKRMFLTSSYSQFWHYYSQLQQDQRHYYEVIAEGAVCKLYFDLEFSRELNPNSNGNIMVDLLIQHVCYHLYEQFHVLCDASHVLCLDSTTPTKFSQHLIFNIPSAAFRDNSHAGNFVHHICDRIIPTNYHINSIIITKEVSQSVATTSIEEQLADYHVNPCNIITTETSQTVATTSVEEQSSDDHVNPYNIITTETSQTVATAGVEEQSADDHVNPCSLITTNVSHSAAVRDQSTHEDIKETVCNPCSLITTNVSHSAAVRDQSTHEDINETVCNTTDNYPVDLPRNLDLLFVLDKDGRKKLFCDLGVYSKNRTFRLYLSSKMGKTASLQLAQNNMYRREATREELFMDSLITNVRYDDFLQILTFDKKAEANESRYVKANESRYVKAEDVRPQLQQHADSCTLEGYRGSPYPEIDDYIQSHVISRKGINGTIRRWFYFSESETLLYDIIGNRWCENIQRQHKSNNIMIVVSIKDGIYYQKCHDPECRGQNFKSQDYDLPRHLLPQTFLEDDPNFEIQTSVQMNYSGLENMDIEDMFVDNFDVESNSTVADTSFDDVSDSELLKAASDVEMTGCHGNKTDYG